MAVALTFPTWRQQTAAIKQAITVAGNNICGDWKFRKASHSLPENNVTWFELRPGPIQELGPDEVVQCDNIDPVSGLPVADNPRIELLVGQRTFIVQLRVFSRDQEPETNAAFALEDIRSALRFPFIIEKYLGPADVSIVEMFTVIPMPDPPKSVDLRWQSEALLEIQFAMRVTTKSAMAIGTWIETVAITSDLRNLDPSLQLDAEVMP